MARGTDGAPAVRERFVADDGDDRGLGRMRRSAADPGLAARLEVAGGIFLFLTLVVVTGLSLLISGTPAREQGRIDVEHAMGAQLIGYAVVIATSFLWPARVSWRGDGRILQPLLLYVGFLFAWVPVTVGVWYLWSSLGLDIAPQPHLMYFTRSPGGLGLVVLLAVVCVAGPVVEELIFRGYLQTGLTTWVGPRWAIVLTGVVFGAIHVGESAIAFVPIALLGILFGWLRHRFDGLHAPILAHIAHNTLTVTLAMAAPELFDPLQNR